MNNIFKASWIKSKRNNKYCATEFLKDFETQKKIAKAELSVTSHGVFVAELNGKRVGSDVLAPGWTSYETRLQYMTYDVTGLLKKGKNKLSVRVGRGWYFHRVKAWGNKELKPDETALICALTVTFADGGEMLVLSGAGWKSRRTRTVYNDMYNGETCDLTKRRGALSSVAVIRYPKEILIPLEGEPIREQERFPGAKLIVTPKGEKVIDFGQEVTGYVEFTADVPAGTEIRLKHFEVLTKEGNVYTENYRSAKALLTVISAGKKFTFKPEYTFFGFRYICVEGVEDPDPADFTAIAVHSEMKRTGHFECSVPLLNRFCSNVIWGQKGNFLDVPTDCPQRDERLGWTGDADVFSRTAAINYDVRVFFRKWLRDLAAEQTAEGAVPSTCPVSQFGTGYASPAWADAATVIPWELYNAYGDVEQLRENFPMMKKWVDYMILECRRKAKEKKADAEYYMPWTTGGFGDWLSLDKEDNEDANGRTDKGLIGTAYLALGLRIVAEAGKILGKDMSFYENFYEHTVAFFRKEYMRNGRMKQDTQTAAVLALCFGLTDDPAATGAQLVADVKEHGRLTTGFIGSAYLLNALTTAGADELAVTLLLKDTYPSWLYPVTMGATTVWERWNGIHPDGHFATPGMNSYNHYAYGSVYSWMFRRLAGVTPAAPGYRAVTFAPYTDARIERVCASIETDLGTVASKYELKDGVWTFEFTVPEGCEAVAELGGERFALKAGVNTFARAAQ
ncbi:MAG: family 78 glycoside hydrolase catalytic domain [Clostridia bacterium]|nr:family 78 glycoside hydrolase catalytic domain [Clostridia bacterium]